MKSFKNKIIIGIDHGYGNIKTANHCFKTGITAHDSEPLFTKDMLVYNGRYYLIGEGHKEFMPEKQNDEDYYVLTLAAIATELSDSNLTEADVIIAAGLPLTWTSGQKAEFATYLSKNKEVEFTFRNVDFHIRISDVKIYPQGYSAVVPIKSTLKGLSMVADIGNGTMNTLYLINGRPQSGMMYTEKFGTYQCTLAIREGFMRKTRRELNDYIIDEVLQTGTANIPVSDLEIISAIAEEYVTEIFRRLREHHYDEDTMDLYVCGGGGCLIKNFYQGSFNRVKFIDDICAAAKGYEYLADVYLRAEAKNER
ncbi:MAG: ParM/StbA family protein [Eubacterium sp.]|nr:ParM/StbA family protein [Eubacterium sp.]